MMIKAPFYQVFMLCCVLLTQTYLINAQASIQTLDASIEEEIRQKMLDRSPEQTLSIAAFGDVEFEVTDRIIYNKATRDLYPNHQNYQITSSDQKQNGNLLISPTGVFINVYENGLLTSIYPDKHSPNYIFEKGSSKDFTCGNHGGESISNEVENLMKIDLIQNGDFQRVYRLAAVCTGEYYIANGGNATDVTSWLNFVVNGVSAIFRNELGVDFTFSVTPTIYPNPDSDLFIPDNDPGADGRTTQARNAIGALYSINDYDIGHVFHSTSVGGDWSGGGVANRPAVCRDFIPQGDLGPIKAGGWSGSFNNQSNGFISLAAHEFGHMFGANHTFNGEGSNCDDAISPVAAYEIASGTTIMSYNGICQADNNIPSSGTADDYFHTHSLSEMIDHMLGSGNCHSSEDLNNSAPSSNANPCNIEYTVPLRTPFFVTGEGSDPDGDDITYCWEQYDEDGESGTSTQGLIGVNAGNRANTPLFRSYPPSPDPVRYFPKFDDIITNTQDPFEVLPRVNRDITLRLTVRDNHPQSGAISIDETVISAGPGGPLQVINPGTRDAGETFDFSWDVNGSEALCDQVDIFLSIDGGSSFTIPLATNVDYADGDTGANEQLSITLPAGLPSTTEARYMVRCSDNPCIQFFAITTQNATINSTCLTSGSIICDTDPLVVEQTDPALDIDETFSIGKEVGSISASITLADPTVNPVRIGLDGNCQEVPAGNQRADIIEFTVTESGTYSISLVNNDDSQYVSIFDAESYDDANPCASFISSNARESSTNPGTGFTSYSFSFSAELEKCVKYQLVGFSFSNSGFTTFNYQFNGPGSFFIEDENDPDYSYTFVAENQISNSIIQVSDLGDFTTLPGGEYRVYGVMYKSGGDTPPEIEDPSTWPGMSINDLLAGGACLLNSANFKPITIEGGCSVFDVQLAELDECILEPTYSAILNVFFANIPENATLDISGSNGTINQSVPLNSSPQTVIIPNQPSSGEEVILTLGIPEDPLCAIVNEITYTAPAVSPVIDTVEVVLQPTGCLTSDGSISISTLNAGDFTYILSAPGQPDIESTTGVFSNLAPGFYQAEVNTNGACVAEYGTIITLEGQNDLTIQSEESVSGCDGEVDPITVMSNTGTQYVWTEINTPLDTLNRTDTYSPTATGLYQVVVTDELTGCTQSTFIDVTLEESPTTNFPADTIICQFEQFVLQSDPVDGFGNFIWQFDGDVITDASSNSVIATQPGQYTVEVTNFANCKAFDTFNLELYAVPTFNLGEDIATCQGEIIDLDVASQIIINDPSYQWSGPGGMLAGETQSNLQITDMLGNGTYSLVVTDNQTACSFTDFIDVNFVEQPEITIEDDETIVCEGSNVTIISMTNFADVSWTLNGDTLIDVSEAFVTINDGGELIAATGTSTCIDRDTIQVTVEPAPFVALGGDIAGCQGDMITLNANNGNDSFDWYVDDINLVTNSGDEYVATVAGTYTAIATNAAGCESRDSVEVILEDVYEIDLGPDLELCSSDVTAIEPITDAPQVSWYYSPTEVPDIEGTADFIGTSYFCPPNGTGFYVAETLNNDCKASDTLFVEKRNAPELDIDDRAYLCGPGNSVVLSTEAQTDVDYSWTLSGTGDLGISDPEIEVNQMGQYILTATDEIGCSNTAVINVNAVNINFDLEFTINGLEQTPILDTLTVCANNNNTLNVVANAENTADFVTYEWFRSSPNGLPISTSNILMLSDEVDDVYYVTFQHVNSGCENIDSFFVKYIFPPEITIDDVTACSNDPLILDTGLEGITHNWYLDNELLSESSSMLEVMEDGNYIVIAFDDPSCQSQDEINIEFKPSPVVLPLEDDSFCTGDEVTLQVTSDGNYSYQWFLDGVAIPGATDENYVTSTPGFYEVGISTSDQCTDTLSSTIIESVIDMLELGEDRQLCPGETITLTPEIGTFENYQWSTNEVTNSIEISAAEVTEEVTTTYTLIVNNGEGCSRTDEIDVTTFPIITAEIVADKADICPMDSIQLNVESNGGLYFIWNNAESLDDPAIANPVASPTSSTTYVVQVFNDCPDNMDVDSIEVIVYPESEVTAAQDTACAFENVPFTLSAAGGVEYSWNMAELIQGEADIADPTILIDEETTFTVTITDEFGCEYIEDVTVCVLDNAESVISPISIITPNGDGKNDVLYFEGLESFPNNKITIFNRWGNVIYSETSYQENGAFWDGTNGGELLPADTYYYILEFNGLILKSSLTITRD